MRRCGAWGVGGGTWTGRALRATRLLRPPRERCPRAATRASTRGEPGAVELHVVRQQRRAVSTLPQLRHPFSPVSAHPALDRPTPDPLRTARWAPQISASPSTAGLSCECCERRLVQRGRAQWRVKLSNRRQQASAHAGPQGKKHGQKSLASRCPDLAKRRKSPGGTLAREQGRLEQAHIAECSGAGAAASGPPASQP